MADLFPISLDDQIDELSRTLRAHEPTTVYLGRWRRPVIVDLEDLYLLASHNWWFSSEYLYRIVKKEDVALGTFGRRRIPFHKEVIGAPLNVIVDHANGKSFDNRKGNLRIATHRQNTHNSPRLPGGTSRYKGVSFNKDRGNWIASIKCAGYVKHSAHKTEIEAALAYDARAIELHGDFARLNFPPWPDRADGQIAAMEAAIESLHRLKGLDK